MLIVMNVLYYNFLFVIDIEIIVIKEDILIINFWIFYYDDDFDFV